MNRIKKVLQWSKQHALALVIYVLGLILAAVIGRITTTALNRHDTGGLRFEPYIAVVVSKESVDFPIPEEFLRGFQDGSSGKTYLETRDGRKVDVRTFEDLGSVEEARRIANDLVHDQNCILAIGNSNSTLTATTLDVFLGSSDPPSYILPIATANELITKAKTAGHGAVLRMVPDNAEQADVIQRLIANLAPTQRAAIYIDEENPVYSLNLSRDIASRVRRHGGRIVIEEMLGPSNSIYSSREAWKSEKPPDIIVFVGVAHHGLLLIDQLSELAVHTPLVFTDGCMVGALIENIAKIPNRAFVLSPVGGKNEATQMPTYQPIGRDAYTLTSQIISGCSNCTRTNLRSHISQTKQQTMLSNGNAGEYSFNADGNNIGMRYHVYEITGGKLKEVTQF